jgi:tetratricopeptide (TPR) repeat protein
MLGAGVCLSAQQPSASIADREKGLELYSKKDYQAAIAALQSATKLDRHDVIAWYYLGLCFEQLGQNESAIPAFEKAAKINPEDYFESLGTKERDHFDQRLLEVRPLLIAAANSAVHYQALNKSLAGDKKQEWVDRLANLYDYATIATSTEVAQRAKITKWPTFHQPERMRNVKLIGELTILVILRADGVVKGVTTFGYVPKELQNAFFRATTEIKFDPAIKDGRPISQLTMIRQSRYDR